MATRQCGCYRHSKLVSCDVRILEERTDWQMPGRLELNERHVNGSQELMQEASRAIRNIDVDPRAKVRQQWTHLLADGISVQYSTGLLARPEKSTGSSHSYLI